MKPFTIPKVLQGHHNPPDRGCHLAEPLSPLLIHNLGLGAADAPDIDPQGSWRLSYRTWANHGWTHHQNKDTGHVEIERLVEGDALKFAVRQVIVNTDGMFQRLEARLRCADDVWASLLNWHCELTCYDTSQNPMPGLGMEVAGRVAEDGRSLTLKINECEASRELDGPLVSQWLIPDLLQRAGKDLPKDKFTLLEHHAKLKPAQRLAWSDVAAGQRVPGCGELRRIHQIGLGILPWEYWRNGQGRVLYAFSGTVMHILDEDAPARTEKLIEELVHGGVHYEY